MERGSKPTEAVDNRLDGEAFERLHRTTNELYAADSIEECIDRTATAAIDILGFEWCIVLEADHEIGRFKIAATEGETELEVETHPFAIDEGVAGSVFEGGDPTIVNDVVNAEEAEPVDQRIRSGVVVPIGEWGVFEVLGTETDSFDVGHIRLLELLVAPLATTIERIQREAALRQQTEALAQQNRQIESIHAVSTSMKVATQKQDIYELFVETVEQVLDIDICTLDERDGDVLKTRAVGSGMTLEDFYTETPLDRQDSLAVETYNTGGTQIVDDLADTGYRAADSGYRSLLSVPLGEWGIFQAATEAPEAFGETDRRLIELLADAADAAIERIERETELERRATELSAQNERLDQFASRVSHEMRNPLSVLETRMELARETGDDEHFEHMERSVHRLNRLINDTLTLAREGDVALQVETVRLDDLAREYWKGIRTPHTELVVETDALIRADKDRLHQLLSNLFRNAVEHAGTDVTVTVGDLQEGFYVEDDGIGISPEQRDAVLTSGTSGLTHGTGLGLAVVDRVADAHDWTLTLTESRDGGARFEFSDVEVVPE